MNKNVAIMFALVTLLLVAALFDGDGTIPSLAEAGTTAHTDASSQQTEVELTRYTDAHPETAIAPAVSAPGLPAPPAPAPNEPDPPFVQPEPLK